MSENDSGAGGSGAPLLSVTSLSVSYAAGARHVQAVDDVSFDLAAGRCLGIAGESGSGKTALGLALLGLNGPAASVSGSIRLDGEELLGDQTRRLVAARGHRIAMIFQDPLSSLHPLLTVGEQIAEKFRAHTPSATRRAAREHAVAMLERVGIPRAAQRAADHPHQFSGGMRQRVMIAMALSCDPDVVVADEPTTALDVTVQAQMLELLNELRRERNLAVILVTHDLGVMAGMADDVVVMYGGRIVEQAQARALLKTPSHPYTAALLQAVPRIDRAVERLKAIPGQPGIPPGGPAQCYFNPRCPVARTTEGRCATVRPLLREDGPGHRVACHVASARVRELLTEKPDSGEAARVR